MDIDKRRFRPIVVRPRGGGIHELRIDGVLWAEVNGRPRGGRSLSGTRLATPDPTVAEPQEAIGTQSQAAQRDR
jgi:hypothetical protein